MEAETVELEDGEIVDNESLDIFASYNILQRPQNVRQIEEPPIITYSDESDDSVGKGSDSDDTDSDSTQVKCKKQKILTKRYKKKPHKTSNDKYKVWLTQMQEELLTENLVSCGVTTSIYSDRNVESYDFTLSRKMSNRMTFGGKSSDEEKEKEVRRYSNKRTFADRSNGKLRLETGISKLGLGKNYDDGNEEKNSSRVILNLSTNADSSDNDVAEDITSKLGEKKSDLIKRVVDIIGKEKAIEFYEKTKKIEEDGGMLILNGSRRRTPGGIYLFLVKNDRHIPRADIRKIFIQDKKEHVDQRRKASAAVRRDQTLDLRRRLENNSDKDIPALLTRAELSTRQIAEEARLRRGEGMDRIPIDADRTVSNPPPSPVTDDPDHAEQLTHGRQIQNYNDDILELGLDADSMDLF